MQEDISFLNIARLISHSISGVLSPEDKKTLESWRTESSENELLYQRFISPEFLKEKSRLYFNSTRSPEEAFRKFLLAKAEKERVAKRKKRTRYLAYAAMWILPVLGIGLYFMQHDSVNTPSDEYVQPILSAAGNAPILVLETGERIEMSANNKEVLSQKGVELIENDKGNDKNKSPEWRKIVTPKSTTFDFVLSDGTKVCLNSETTFEYRSPFDNEERLVRVSGEAYLVVAKSETPFKVQLEGLEVDVLGTRFNVRNYIQSGSVKVTLAQGSIRATTRDNSFIIEPEQQVYLDKKSQSAFVKSVNVADELSWMQNIYTFKEETLREVSRVIEDWYEVKVIFETNKAANAVYTGVISKAEDLRLFVERINSSSKGVRARVEKDILYIQ